MCTPASAATRDSFFETSNETHALLGHAFRASPNLRVAHRTVVFLFLRAEYRFRPTNPVAPVIRTILSCTSLASRYTGRVPGITLPALMSFAVGKRYQNTLNEAFDQMPDFDLGRTIVIVRNHGLVCECTVLSTYNCTQTGSVMGLSTVLINCQGIALRHEIRFHYCPQDLTCIRESVTCARNAALNCDRTIPSFRFIPIQQQIYAIGVYKLNSVAKSSGRVPWNSLKRSSLPNTSSTILTTRVIVRSNLSWLIILQLEHSFRRPAVREK